MTREPKEGGSGSRREFLRVTAAGAVGAASGLWCDPSSARAAETAPSACERVNVALIGRGIMGSGHLRHLLGRTDVRVVAVCDVDLGRREEGCRLVEETYGAERTSGIWRGCASVNDYREILARPDVDAVVVATPDHWHARIAVEAARAGKDIYGEKPVSLTIAEGRELVDSVRRYARVFQTGSQYRSIPTIRRVCDFVRGGGLGQVKSVFTLWGKIAVPTVGGSNFPLDPPLPAEAPPAGLDWDLWVGPARYRPYHPAYHRNPPPGVVPWVFCEAFGAGAVTNYHSHAADVIQYAIGMETSGPVEVIHPESGAFPTLTCRYANGVLLHHVANWNQVKSLYHAVPDDARLAGMFGGLFVGERGWITSMSGTDAGPVEAGPKELLAQWNAGMRRGSPGSNNHHANWLDCIHTRRQPSSHEEIGHRSASLGHLVNLAFKLGRSLKWDPLAEQFRDDPEANRLLARAQRAPWDA